MTSCRTIYVLFLLWLIAASARADEEGVVFTLALHTYNPPVENYQEYYGDVAAPYNHNRIYLAFRKSWAGPMWWGVHYLRWGAKTKQPYGDVDTRLSLDNLGGTLFLNYPWSDDPRFMAYVGIGLDVGYRVNHAKWGSGYYGAPNYIMRTGAGGWHYVAGCTLRLRQHLAVELGYLRMPQYSIGTSFIGESGDEEGEWRGSMLLVGLSWVIWGYY